MEAAPIKITPADDPRQHGAGQKSYRVRHFDVDIRDERRKLRVVLDVDTHYANQSHLTVDLFDGDKWNTIVTATPSEIDLVTRDAYRDDRGHLASNQYRRDQEAKINKTLGAAERKLLDIAKVVLS